MTAGAGGSLRQTPYDAVIFDMDGVVTDTAALHAEAWKRLFDEVLADPSSPCRTIEAAVRPGRRLRPLRRGAARGGRCRRLPRGPEHSRPDRHTRGPARDLDRAWSRRSQERPFLEQLAADGVRAFPGTASLVRRLRQSRIPLGLATASRNAAALLSWAGLLDALDVVVDGEVVAGLGLPGKPDPAMFLEAARRTATSRPSSVPSCQTT